MDERNSQHLLDVILNADSYYNRSFPFTQKIALLIKYINSTSSSKDAAKKICKGKNIGKEITDTIIDHVWINPIRMRILLSARYNSDESPLHKSKLPQDMFIHICNIACVCYTDPPPTGIGQSAYGYPNYEGWLVYIRKTLKNRKMLLDSSKKRYSESKQRKIDHFWPLL